MNTESAISEEFFATRVKNFPFTASEMIRLDCQVGCCLSGFLAERRKLICLAECWSDPLLNVHSAYCIPLVVL